MRKPSNSPLVKKQRFNFNEAFELHKLGRLSLISSQCNANN
jgi:hypothetical protein